jgi:DNA invertase Pin-like site-specific DNA recombinase
MLTVLGAVAGFERALMLERQREGIAKARTEGRYKGRKPTAMAKADDARRLHGGGAKPAEIARRLGISRASVYRVLAQLGQISGTTGKPFAAAQVQRLIGQG